VFTLSNVLTILRFPAAFVFLINSVPVRLFALVVAMVSDSLDGYFARKNKTESQFGAMLDPIMDKFFVFFTLTVLVLEGKLPIWAMVVIVARDFFLFIFGLYLTLTKSWAKLEFRSIIWGKLTTVFQFCVLVLIVSGFVIPWYAYLLFIPMGLFTAYGLYRGFKKII
jgi:CDP-diacylglycerol--glycerol-3-phosphate 3-phosphatidyltransferase